ncbi:MAG: hypothetical protein C4289_15985 [Chloroflexota bacterium]
MVYRIAACMELAIVTPGEPLDEVVRYLQEAVALHLEGEDPAAFGLAENSVLSVIMELEPAHA